MSSPHMNIGRALVVNTIFVLFVFLFTTPSMALNSEVEGELKLASVLYAFRNSCDQTVGAEELYNDLEQKLIHKGGISKDEAQTLIKSRAAWLSVFMMDEDKKAKFCLSGEEAIQTYVAMLQPSYSNKVLKNKVNLILDSLIIGVMGTLVGYLIGFIWKLSTGRNPNADPRWLAGWGLGAILIVRLLLTLS